MEVCWFIPWQVNYTLCMEEDCLVPAVAKLEQHILLYLLHYNRSKIGRQVVESSF